MEDYIQNHKEVKANIININVWLAKKFKFDIEIPNNTKDALTLDRLNDNMIQKDAIDKELTKINDYKTFWVWSHPGSFKI